MLFKLYRRLLPFARPYRAKMVISSIFNILSNLVGSVNMLALIPLLAVVFGESKSLGSGAAPKGMLSILEKFSDLFVVTTPNGAIDQTGSLVRIALFIFFTYILKNIFQYASGYMMALVE